MLLPALNVSQGIAYLLTSSRTALMNLESDDNHRRGCRQMQPTYILLADEDCLFFSTANSDQ